MKILFIVAQRPTSTPNHCGSYGMSIFEVKSVNAKLKEFLSTHYELQVCDTSMSIDRIHMLICDADLIFIDTRAGLLGTLCVQLSRRANRVIGVLYGESSESYETDLLPRGLKGRTAIKLPGSLEEDERELLIQLINSRLALPSNTKLPWEKD